MYEIKEKPNKEKTPQISLVVPCHNEEGSLPFFLRSACDALSLTGTPYEIIITDDASTDNSWNILSLAALSTPCLKAKRLQTRCGQSAALWEGILSARGEYIITMDSDLQNDPREIPLFLDALRNCDCVCGKRINSPRSQEPLLDFLSSRIANWTRNFILRESITDSGCAFKAFRKDCLNQIVFFNGAHRFLASLLLMQGSIIMEIPVKSLPRLSGKSHYSILNRFLAAFIDLLGVWWLKTRMIKSRVVKTIEYQPTDTDPHKRKSP